MQSGAKAASGDVRVEPSPASARQSAVNRASLQGPACQSAGSRARLHSLAALAALLSLATATACLAPGGSAPGATASLPLASAPGVTAAPPSSAVASSGQASALPAASVGPSQTVLPGASHPPVPLPTPSGLSPAEAVRLVLRSDVRFVGIGARDPALIGQTSWYQVEPVVGGYEVTVRIGWGDCPSGCIYEHVWTYAVSADGQVNLRGQSGDPLPAGPSGVAGFVLAGPVCPVERVPPDPACAPRAVAGAVLVVRDAAGGEVARTTSSQDGSYRIDLPPGTYTLQPQPVAGLLGRPASIPFAVPAGGSEAVRLDVTYDTGIR